MIANKRTSMRRIIVALLTIFSLLTPSFVRAANDYMEKASHYQAYTVGADCIHFKVYTWSYGSTYDYKINSASYVGYRLEGTEEVVQIAYYGCTDWNGVDDKQNGKGTARMKLEEGMGDIFVTSMYSGVRKHVDDTGEWTSQMEIKQDDDKARSVLEFDWFLPESLNNKSFSIVIHPDG